MLEFKQTTDFFPDSFERVLLRRWVKYQPLIEDLKKENPKQEIELLVFVLSASSLFNENR